ncbi:MAG TPA: hypothetical protein VGK52_13475 [Polyangia bacterium]|jgi:hypothetical protein
METPDRIWIIGSDWWPRAYLRAELIERGHDAVGFITIRDAVITLTLGRARRPGLIVCDLHGQALDPELARGLFQARAPIIAIAGNVEAEDGWIRGLPWTAFLRRPITIGAVADMVGRLTLPAAPSPEETARYT